MVAHAAGIVRFQRQVQLFQDNLAVVLNNFRQVQGAGGFKALFQKIAQPSATTNTGIR